MTHLTKDEQDKLYNFMDILKNEFIHNELEIAPNTDNIYIRFENNAIVILRVGLITHKHFMLFKSKRSGLEVALMVKFKLSNRNVFHENLSLVTNSLPEDENFRLSIRNKDKDYPFFPDKFKCVTFEAENEDKLNEAYYFIRNNLNKYFDYL